MVFVKDGVVIADTSNAIETGTPNTGPYECFVDESAFGWYMYHGNPLGIESGYYHELSRILQAMNLADSDSVVRISSEVQSE